MKVAFMSYQTQATRGHYLSNPIGNCLSMEDVFRKCIQEVTTEQGVNVDEIYVISFNVLPAWINDRA